MSLHISSSLASKTRQAIKKITACIVSTVYDVSRDSLSVVFHSRHSEMRYTIFILSITVKPNTVEVLSLTNVHECLMAVYYTLLHVNVSVVSNEIKNCFLNIRGIK